LSVCTRKDGQVFVQWQEAGKKHRKYFGKGLQARAKAIEYNAVVTSRQIRRTAAPMFAELCVEYLVAKSTSAPITSIKNLRYKLDGVILPAMGNKNAMSIDSATLDIYVKARAKSVKMTTIHRELSDIRAILNWSVKRKLISHNPMAGYDMPTRDDKTVLPVSHDEIERIIAHSADHLKRAILLSFFCGLRPGAVELLSIKYNQVDWSAGSITIISAKKGGIQRREIPIHPDLPLRDWYEQDGRQNERHIITYNGRPIKRLKRAWQRANERAGLAERKITMYSIRHAFVTTMLHNGVDVHTVADISGHDPHTMLKHYAHSMDKVRRAAIDGLPGLHPPGAWVQKTKNKKEE